MKIKEGMEQDYASFRENNTRDGYSAGVVRYAERWCDMMEQEMENGATVAEATERTNHSADTEGITGFMYGCAVRALCQFWEHGEELRQWHNQQYGHSDDSIVNPAIIHVEGNTFDGDQEDFTEDESQAPLCRCEKGVDYELFEGELQRMFGNNDIISEPKIVGRTLLGKIDDDLRVKLQFVSTEVHKHYDAIQVSILNRTDGLVDRETMLFGDIIGVKNTNISGRVNPYMWEEGVGKAYWYTPVSVSEKAQIADTVLDYVGMYQSEGMAMSL